MPTHGIYTNLELLEKINQLGHKAAINKRGLLVTVAGAPLVYNYNNGRFEFKNSKEVPMWLGANGKFYKHTNEKENRRLRARLNFPGLYQTVLEDQAFVEHRNNTDLGKKVPYIKEKEIKISNGKSKGVPISLNLIDSIIANLPTRSDLKVVLGIGSRETDVGKYPSYSIKTPGENNKFSMFQLEGSVTPTELLNDHNYFISPMRGTLNSVFNGKYDLIYGSPEATYNHNYYLNFELSDSHLLEAEANILYLRKKGTFNPDVKRTNNDYYNPEDNPYLHALQYFYDKNYGMGKDYVNAVKTSTKDIEYLIK